MDRLSQNSTLISQEVTIETQQERVVFALAPESREQFFPLFHPDEFPAMDCHWLDSSSMKGSEWEKVLSKLQPTVLITGWGTPAIPESFAHAEDISLRYLCHLKGTVRNLVPRCLIERGVWVSNWGPSISYTVAEHALLLVLASLRNLPAWADVMDKWPGRPYPAPKRFVRTNSLRGQRVGLHGFGSIARELVHLLKPFKVDLAAYSSGVPRAAFESQGVRCCGSLKELFSRSDIVIECEALTSENKATVNEEILLCLPKGAVFVNVGRGQIVDEEALIRVAAKCELRLGLDVYQREPLPAASGLHQLPCATLSPHIAGPTDDAYSVLWNHAMNNLRQYLMGAKIDSLVTLDIYDRST